MKVKIHLFLRANGKRQRTLNCDNDSQTTHLFHSLSLDFFCCCLTIFTNSLPWMALQCLCSVWLPLDLILSVYRLHSHQKRNGAKRAYNDTLWRSLTKSPCSCSFFFTFFSLILILKYRQRFLPLKHFFVRVQPSIRNVRTHLLCILNQVCGRVCF